MQWIKWLFDSNPDWGWLNYLGKSGNSAGFNFTHFISQRNGILINSWHCFVTVLQWLWEFWNSAGSSGLPEIIFKIFNQWQQHEKQPSQTYPSHCPGTESYSLLVALS